MSYLPDMGKDICGHNELFSLLFVPMCTYKYFILNIMQCVIGEMVLSNQTNRQIINGGYYFHCAINMLFFPYFLYDQVIVIVRIFLLSYYERPIFKLMG